MIKLTVKVDDFKRSNDRDAIQAAIDYAFANEDKTVELGNRDYVLRSGIIIKEGVKLHSAYKSRLLIYGNFRVIELQRNASLVGAYIVIDSPVFANDVIYLDGKYKYYNSWHRTVVKEINIVNWNGNNKGTGVRLYSHGTDHEISFVGFENIKIVGLHTAITLEALKPPSGFSWVNANRFSNITIDDCVECVRIKSGETIPNECSGNLFRNMQIQPSSRTNYLFTINGQYNEFHGVAWDMHEIKNKTPVEFTTTSSFNTLKMRSVEANRIVDKGKSNLKVP